MVGCPEADFYGMAKGIWGRGWERRVKGLKVTKIQTSVPQMNATIIYHKCTLIKKTFILLLYHQTFSFTYNIKIPN